MASRFYIPCSVLAGLVCALAPAWASAQAPPTEDAPCPGVIYTLDGSGGLSRLGRDLGSVVQDAHGGLRVELFPWSYGTGRIFSDLHGRGRHQSKGHELGQAIQAVRQKCPTARIVLVCHSSGAAVGLAAAEQLPAGSIDRIVLLAPAVSYRYDLRPALRCCREGIDVFYSRKDLISYSLSVVGTADGRLLSAGAVGFEADNDPLYQHLHQHSGLFGGHYGCTSASFLSAHVAPLLAAPR